MAKTPPSKKKPAGGGFDFYDFKAMLEDQYGKQKADFFAMAWRQIEGDLLETASRYSKLVDWCSKEIQQSSALINAFSPADKNDSYTNGFFKVWLDQVHYVAELVYLRGLLVDSRTTNEQRTNIEYTICKRYGVRYNEYLEDYV